MSAWEARTAPTIFVHPLGDVFGWAVTLSAHVVAALDAPDARLPLDSTLTDQQLPPPPRVATGSHLDKIAVPFRAGYG